MYHFYVQGERDGKGGTSACHYESMTEQTNTFRSTDRSHGMRQLKKICPKMNKEMGGKYVKIRLTGVNLVCHQCCNNGQYPQG